MAIKFDASGLNSALSYFKRTKNNISSKARGANLAAIVVLDRWVQKNFKAQGALHENNYGPWKPLAASTIKRRRQGSSTILQDTGRLKNSFIHTATKEGATLSTNVEYAKIHENGKGRVPQRKIFPSIEQAEKIIKPVYEAFIQNAIKT